MTAVVSQMTRHNVATTLQEVNFHLNLNFAISLMKNSLNLNLFNRNVSMRAYII